MKMQITLEAARVLMGYSLREAAEKFGVHYQTLSSWEKNPNKMKGEYIEKIPEIYGVEKNAIFFGTQNEFIRYLRNENEKNKLNNIM